MEELTLDFFSTSIHVWLFVNVKNAMALRNSLVEASRGGVKSEQERLDWAFLDASMITSRQHLVTAVCQALVTRLHGDLKTKTIHSEILWALSPSTNIMDAIKKFGLGPRTTEILLVKLLPTNCSQPKDQLNQAALDLVEGQISDLNQLGHSLTKWNELKRLYKLNEDVVIKELDEKMKHKSNDSEREMHAMIDQLVVSTVALKSVAG
ncbi:hypothetical protein O181_034323 [Austropuccinia psidii MF-1]|uniref:EKC/KEOPS complex subunit CGI121 n=1 Tax=Austropuccinia psidii MF-1 TaxID=1389203 RepID=A0A9Q3D587_9BASI|nr:hypothetical protein [Austropuccinia psidii MF-1]